MEGANDVKDMVALNEVELGAVSGGKLSNGEVCTSTFISGRDQGG